MNALDGWLDKALSPKLKQREKEGEMRETSSLFLNSNPSDHKADFDAVGDFLRACILRRLQIGNLQDLSLFLQETYDGLTPESFSL